MKAKKIINHRENAREEKEDGILSSPNCVPTKVHLCEGVFQTIYFYDGAFLVHLFLVP